MKANELRKACITQVGNDKCTQNFILKVCREDTSW